MHASGVWVCAAVLLSNMSSQVQRVSDRLVSWQSLEILAVLLLKAGCHASLKPTLRLEPTLNPKFYDLKPRQRGMNGPGNPLGAAIAIMHMLP